MVTNLALLNFTILNLYYGTQYFNYSSRSANLWYYFNQKTDFRRTLNFDPIEEVLQFTLDNVSVLTPDTSAYSATPQYHY